jgi:hypothetical protein
MVGRQAHERDRVDTVGAQPLLEVGPDERRVDVLRDHGLAWQRRGLGLEVDSRRTGEKYSLVRRTLVAHVDDRGAAFAPGAQRFRDLALGAGIVALAPGGVVELPLNVDDDECRVTLRIHDATESATAAAVELCRRRDVQPAYRKERGELDVPGVRLVAGDLRDQQGPRERCYRSANQSSI